MRHQNTMCSCPSRGTIAGSAVAASVGVIPRLGARPSSLLVPYGSPQASLSPRFPQTSSLWLVNGLHLSVRPRP
jgi:hypothetical protein